MAGGSRFARELRRRQGRPSQAEARRRRWVYVAYDQLSGELGPLGREAPEELGIVLVENPAKAARRPYHKQKLALVLANGRQFALEQAERGVLVRHAVAREGYVQALGELAAELGPLRMMEPAERELRVELEPLFAAGALESLPHEGWLTDAADFEAAAPEGPPWRMDAFYRHVRRRTGILMENGRPLGGAFSFDAENRRPWRGEPPAPAPPRFEPDGVTAEVLQLVATRYAAHPGELDGGALPSTAADAARAREHALERCLTHFGPFEDAMSVRSSSLFHTRLAPLLNLQRLLARDVLAAALARDVPLPSKEGFVRQVLGWREFVRHVHEATDGLRQRPNGTPLDLRDGRPLVPAYWGAPSGLACLDRVVAGVWRTGYSHHIERLMVLSNIATLLDLDPRELSSWFHVAYTDAYDWVVEPNVLGMGTFALGELFTTKPYVSGAAYLARMSDDCGACAFDPQRDCPLTRLYWAFLERHRDSLESNPRLKMPYASLRRRAAHERAADAAHFERVGAALAAGEKLGP